MNKEKYGATYDLLIWSAKHLIENMRRFQRHDADLTCKDCCRDRTCGERMNLSAEQLLRVIEALEGTYNAI